MAGPNEASVGPNKLRDHEVRIICLPPSAVASICCIGGMPEIESGRLLNAFITDNRLYEIKPDFRHYGFNNPNGSLPDGSDHGYERWITIPEEMEVLPPFVKKRFAGGLYCAHMIPMGSFEEWLRLVDWVQTNGNYTFREGMREQDCMEEHLNYINKYMLSPDDSSIQIDLLIPVKEI